MPSISYENLETIPKPFYARYNYDAQRVGRSSVAMASDLGNVDKVEYGAE